jgi:hypothetical protein
LRASLRFTWQALNDIPLLRHSVLLPVLISTVAALALASFGASPELPGSGMHGLYSPRLFAFLYIPAEFLIYDLIQGNPDLRVTFSRLWLDWRLLRAAWTWLLAVCMTALPSLLLMALLVFATVGFTDNQQVSGSQALSIGIGSTAVALVSTYLLSRFLYLTQAVARRDRTPLRTAFGETRGRMWRIFWPLLAPFTAMLAVSVGVEILGPVLERHLGLVALAPWFLLDACLAGFTSCLGATVLALSRQRTLSEASQDAADQNAAVPPRPTQD